MPHAIARTRNALMLVAPAVIGGRAVVVAFVNNRNNGAPPTQAGD